MNEHQSREQMQSEIARLQARNRELEAHNQELQARVRQQDEAAQRQKRAWMEWVFAKGGETGAVLAKRDWSSTSVGPIESWPESLCNAISICLLSRIPMRVAWGTEYVAFYNDAVIPTYGPRHPHVLGDKLSTFWPEIWDDVVLPMYESVRRTGKAVFIENSRFSILRHGHLEERYFTQCISPICEGRIG